MRDARMMAPMICAALLALSGCASDAPAPARQSSPPSSATPPGPTDPDRADFGGGVGLTFPPQAGPFAREDVQRSPSGTGVTVGYALVNAPSPLIPTLRVHPSSASESLLSLGGRASIADAESSRAELQASIVQIRHFYPDAVIRDERPAYVVKPGATQTGMPAPVEYS